MQSGAIKPAYLCRIVTLYLFISKNEEKCRTLGLFLEVKSHALMLSLFGLNKKEKSKHTALLWTGSVN